MTTLAPTTGKNYAVIVVKKKTQTTRKINQVNVFTTSDLSDHDSNILRKHLCSDEQMNTKNNQKEDTQ